ncbi:MAG: 3'-5' exonuclease [Drouetiella hepatica Uher 2000/2452]|jgi:DNA polymerase-3 subunit epsilon|uniref:3'-5' exonuclease n=1 Tax=Drouetiella hepatica Uher 2000/2452 TaxID=904376 RepID=A0A951Q9Q0_9CYAN|nr:3'-5' exonuclease [Drouetiella hepatica Uher 2000/2452]
MTNFLALDFETANRSANSACAIGLVRVENDQIVEQSHFLIRPPQRWFEFTNIHGICWEDVAEQPDFGELWSVLAQHLSGVDFIAAHNAPFDRRVLYACCETYGISKPAQEFLCTVQLARRVWQIHPTKLPNVCARLNISLDHHQALSDASACAQIVIAARQVTGSSIAGASSALPSSFNSSLN